MAVEVDTPVFCIGQAISMLAAMLRFNCLAGRSRLGPVGGKRAIQDDDLGAALHDRGAGGVEGALGRAD